MCSRQQRLTRSAGIWLVARVVLEICSSGKEVSAGVLADSRALLDSLAYLCLQYRSCFMLLG